MEISRRDFLKGSISVGTGTALAGLIGSGVNLTPRCGCRSHFCARRAVLK